MQPLLGPETAVLPPTTGIPWWCFYKLGSTYNDLHLPELDPGDRQWSLIGPERVIGCAFWTAAEEPPLASSAKTACGQLIPLGNWSAKKRLGYVV